MKNLLIALLFVLSTILGITIVKDTQQYEILLRKYKATVIHGRVLESQMKKVLTDRLLGEKSVPLENSTKIHPTSQYKI
jgi:hypothetical protein